ncbi:MAG: glycosyl hydrolase [Armatimonadota bacterium]
MEELYSQFQNPPASYRPQPFWFLNHKLEEDRLRWQIREMAAKGVGGVVLHARHGLQTPYMSDEWLRMIGVCVDELRAQGMEAWLYDEDNWPSGTFGGKLTREHPEFRMRYLRIQTLKVTGGATFQSTLDADDNTLMSAQAVPVAEDGSLKLDHPRDVSTYYHEGRFRWDAPPGQWLVALYWECPVAAKVTFANGYYLDTMNDEAVSAFRSLAYDPYDCFKDEFGKTIKGVFTDEPGLMVHDGFFSTQAMRTRIDDLKHKLPGQALAWTRDFEEKFKKVCGYDIRPLMLGLIYDIGPDTDKLRADYFRAISLWYSQNYHGKLSLWCRERDLEYIGHTLEEPLFKQVRTQGNQTWVLSLMDRPGLDYLGHGVGTKENPYRILSGKCAASVAHTQGKARVMCEAFGGSGHGHTLLDRRLDANFMACLGVNMYIPHAFWYSFEGFRKTDWPPTEFYHQPYWSMYKEFADYLARLSYVQALGHHVSGTAILTPIKTMYADMFKDGEPVLEPACQKWLNDLSETMLALHHDYDYVDDTQLHGATIEGGRLAFANSEEKYDLVILPGARVMSSAAVTKLRDLFEAGGKIVALGELPTAADERGKDEGIIEIIQAVFGKADRHGNRHNVNEAGGIAIAGAPKNLAEWLQEQLPSLLPFDVSIEDPHGRPAGDIICCHRRLTSPMEGALQETYLLVNRTKMPQQCLFGCAATGRIEEWSLENGERGPVAASPRPGGGLQVPLEFEPAEARLFVVTPGQPLEEIADLAEPTILEHVELAAAWDFEAQGGNVMILDRWEICLRDIPVSNRMHVPEKINTYRTQFTVTGRPGKVRLVLDDIEQWIPSHVGFLGGIRSLEILVNGQQAPAVSQSEWQDPDYLWVDISSLLREGENDIEIDTISLLNPMHGLREPVYLVGEFTLKHGAISTPERKIKGLFTEQGYPHLAGLGRYRQLVTIPDRFMGERLILDPGEVHGCMRVIVNGETVATRIWPPYEVDITSAARGGNNEIIIEIAGTLGNLYSKEKKPFGLKGPAVIWVMS